MTVATTLLTILLSAPLSGHPSVATRLSAPQRLTVGDRFELTLVVNSPRRSQVLGPLADSMGVFAVGDLKSKTVARSDHDETTYHLSLAGFKPGTHALPVFAFLIRSGQEIDTLQCDTASVTIASVLPEKMKDINDLKPAENFPNPWLWIIPGAVIVAAGLAYAIRRLIRKLRRIQQLAQAPPPPWDEALGALDRLPWREWLDAGQVKRYYYALSEVLKRYIERRFEFDAVEQTTTEMLANLRIHKAPMRDDLGRFLARSDLVKYAKWVPPEEEAQAAINQVREFVMRTKPQEPASEPVGPSAAAGGRPAVSGAGR